MRLEVGAMFIGHEIWLPEILAIPDETLSVDDKPYFQSPNRLRLPMEKFLVLWRKSQWIMATKIIARFGDAASFLPQENLSFVWQPTTE